MEPKEVFEAIACHPDQRVQLNMLDTIKADPELVVDLNRAQLADLIEEAGQDARQQQKLAHREDSGHREMITRDQICDHLDNYITAFRNTLFDTSVAPFASKPDEAISWFQKEAESERTTIQERRKQTEDVCRSREVGELIGHGPEEIHFVTRLARCLGPRTDSGERTELSSPTAIHSKLHTLAVRCQMVADHSGFREAEIAWWILTDERPEIPRVRVVEERRNPFQPNMDRMRCRAIVEIEASDLTREEWHRIYKAVRRFPTSHRQKISKLHYRIYQIVKDKGGPPAKPWSKQFWEPVRQQLINEGIENVPETYLAIAKAHHRLLTASR